MYLNIIKSVLSDNLPIIIIFIVTLVSLRFSYLKTHHNKIVFYKEFLFLIAILYIFLLFQLVTKAELNNVSGFNLVPFQEILRYKIGSKLFYYNVVGNILVFTILGLIISYYVKPKNFITPAIISIIISTTIEFVQLNIGRSFDIDDIILNLVGGLIGYILYVAFVAIYNHLPNILKSDFIYNVICIIVSVLMILYLLNLMGVVNII